MIITEDSYFKKIIGLSIFQTSCIIFFLTISSISYSTVPIYKQSTKKKVIYSSDLSQALMLTAVVVGFTNLSIALALICKIQYNFGTISEKEINK